MSARALAVLAVLAAPASAVADGLCGITARVCRSAETRVRDRNIPMNEPWYVQQDWSPWAASIDPGTRTVDVRFRYGGHQDREGGIGYADPEDQTRHHEIRSCTGSVKSGKVELDIGASNLDSGEATPLVLYFENGSLIRVYDPEAKAQAGYHVAMYAKSQHEDLDGANERQVDARNAQLACPGGGQSAFTVGGSTPSTPAKEAKKKPAGSAPVSPPSGGFEKAQATPGAQTRQQDTGEQGGAGGATDVDFGPETHSKPTYEQCVEPCNAAYRGCKEPKRDDYKECLASHRDDIPDVGARIDSCKEEIYGECDRTAEGCREACRQR